MLMLIIHFHYKLLNQVKLLSIVKVNEVNEDFYMCTAKALKTKCETFSECEVT